MQAKETRRRLKEGTIDFANQSWKVATVGQNRHSSICNARAASSVTCLSFPTDALCNSSFEQVIKETISRCPTYQCGQEPSACSLLFTPVCFSLPHAWLCWLHSFVLMTHPQASTLEAMWAKGWCGVCKADFRVSQNFVLVQAVTASRHSHTSRLYPAPPEAVEMPAGVARDSWATQEEQSAQLGIDRQGSPQESCLWWQPSACCQTRRKTAEDKEGWTRLGVC